MPGVKADNVKLYVKEMYKVFFDNLKALSPKYREIFKVVTNIEGDGIRETQLINVGQPVKRETENAGINFRSAVQGWTFQGKYDEYVDGIALSKRQVQNAIKVKNLLKAYSKGWAQQDIRIKESLAVTVFNEGGNTSGNAVFNGTFTDNTDASGDLLYDSIPMFNLTGNSRRVFSQVTGTYYNAVTGLTLTPANFETLYDLATKTNAVNEREEKVENPVNTCLTETGTQYRIAQRILKTERGIPFSQANDMNPYLNIVEPMDWRYLDDSSAFYVGKRQHEDFQFHERQVPEIRYFRDEYTLGYNATYNSEFGVFIKNWRMWTRGGGTYA